MQMDLSDILENMVPHKEIDKSQLWIVFILFSCAPICILISVLYGFKGLFDNYLVADKAHGIFIYGRQESIPLLARRAHNRLLRGVIFYCLALFFLILTGPSRFYVT